MTSITEIDLYPYGIEGILRNDFEIDLLNFEHLNFGVRTLNFLGNTRGFRFLGKNYIAIERLYDEDCYGEIYRCVAPDGSEYAIKTWRVSGHADFIWVLKECLIQILVVEASKSEPNGPYAPRLYEIAFDPEKSELLIRFEKMRNTLNNLLAAVDEDEQQEVFASASQQLETAKEFLHATFEFSCHDLHKNAMYIRSPDDSERWWRFTDFASTTLRFNGLVIHGRMWDIK